MSRTSWKVIIPSNDAGRLRIAVNSIIDAHPGLDPKQIVVVDDGARAGWLASDPAVTWVNGVKPFIYARNVNIGVTTAGDTKGLVIMGDDCKVATPRAFDMLESTASPLTVGVSSAAIDGPVGNHQQRFRNDPVILETPNPIAFICVFIRTDVWKMIGKLDERFTGYGCLNAEARVMLADGTTRKISEIVNKRQSVEVLSMNVTTEKIESKRVLDWWKGRGPKGQPWLKVVLKNAKACSRLGGMPDGVAFTPDHRLFTKRGWKRADEIVSGDRIFIAEPRLSDRQREFMLGSLLGDASLTGRNRKKAGFQVSHAEKQWGYLDLKRQMLGNFSPGTWDYMPSSSGDIGTQIVARQTGRKLTTRYMTEFADLRSMTYPNGVKTVTKEWLDQLGPFGFAVFYMDNGYVQKGSARLCCHSFGRTGTELIAGRLLELGIDCTIDIDPRPAKYHCEPLLIRMRQDETRVFMRMIGPYVPEVMRYKLTCAAPTFDPSLWEPQETELAYWEEVAAVLPFVPKPGWTHLLRTRYCLSVEDNENFFTTSGLAHNCEDSDFCRRMKDAGFKLIVDHRVRIIHNGPNQPSAWRSQPTISALHAMNKQLFSEKWAPPAGKKVTNVLGLYRVKNEARWIKESLERTLEVTDKVILFDDHSTDKTRDIAWSLKRVMVVESPFEGLDEARDKDQLLKLALAENPRWVVFIDGDEVLTKRAIREIRSIAMGPGGIIRFRIVFLWDYPYQERYDGVYARMCQPRMFSLFDQDATRLGYRRTGFGGNFHCGQVPLGHSGPIRYGYSEIKHYGYMHEEDRVRKYKWYNEKDPGNKLEGEYAHVIGKPSRHAPGPVQLRKWMDT